MNDRYLLEHSHIAIAFQSIFFCIIALILYICLSTVLWFISIVACLFVWLYFKPQRVEIIELLEDETWSLKYRQQSKIQRVHLKKILDHHFYIVIYFQEKNNKSVVIWKDQLDQRHWKRLMIRVNLQ